MERNTKNRQEVHTKREELKDKQLADAIQNTEPDNYEFSTFLKEQLQEESDNMARPIITYQDIELGMVNFQPGAQTLEARRTFQEIVGNPSIVARKIDPEQEELKKTRADLINSLRSGEKRDRMVPLAIPEAVENMRRFPKTKDTLKSRIKEKAADELDLMSFGTSVKDKNAEKEEEFTVTLRVPKSVHDKLTKMVIQRSSDTGEILNKSSYLRLLIEKDFKERTKFNI